MVGLEPPSHEFGDPKDTDGDEAAAAAVLAAAAAAARARKAFRLLAHGGGGDVTVRLGSSRSVE
jgi:hypothetical protein